MRRFAVFTALLVALTAQAHAAENVCNGYGWRPLTKMQVARFGVLRQFQTLVRIIDATYRYGAKPLPFEVHAADCIAHGDDVNVAIALEPTRYFVSVTVGYLEASDRHDIVREGRKLACLMREREFYNPAYTLYQPVPEDAARCMLEEAFKAGDTDYARWLTRTVAPEKQQVGLNDK